MSARAIRGAFGLSLVMVAAVAPGATLGLGEGGSVVGADQVQIPVRLDVGADEAVAGFQFDLHFDARLIQFDRAESGPVTVAAEKSAHANVIRPGLLRVVVAGFNQNAIAAGDVIGLHFSSTDMEREAAALRLSDVILSDPFGMALPVVVVPDTLIVSGGTAHAVTAATTATAVTTSPHDGFVLYRYRAVVFAAIVVGLTMLFARAKPKKGRAR